MMSRSLRKGLKGTAIALSTAAVLSGGALLPAAQAADAPVQVAAGCNPCNPCNPCAAKACNPCNPCAAASPCNPCNPCAAVNPCNPCNPCAATKSN